MSPIRSIVLVQVERALPLISPAYDQGKTEEEIRAPWLQYWRALRPRSRNRRSGDGLSDRANLASLLDLSPYVSSQASVTASHRAIVLMVLPVDGWHLS